MRIIAVELRTVNVCESSWKTFLPIGHMAGKSELNSISYEATFSLQRVFRLFFGISWRIGEIFLYIKEICNNFLGQKQIICELRIFCWFLGILQRVLVRFFLVAGSFQQVVTSCLVVFNSYLLFEFEVACKKLRCPIFWFDETRKKKKIKKKEIHVENVFIERFESDKNIFSTNRTANCGADNGKSSELGGQNRNARSMRVSHSNGKLR